MSRYYPTVNCIQRTIATIVSVCIKRYGGDISILGRRTPSPGRIGGPLPMHFINFLWLDFDSPFARPFGLVRTSIATPNPSQALSRSAIHFSPDGKVLIAGTSQDTLGLELDSRKRFDLALKKALRGAIDLQGSERAIAV